MVGGREVTGALGCVVELDELPEPSRTVQAQAERLGPAAEFDDDGGIDQARDRLPDDDRAWSRNHWDRVAAGKTGQGLQDRPQAVMAQRLELSGGSHARSDLQDRDGGDDRRGCGCWEGSAPLPAAGLPPAVLVGVNSGFEGADPWCQPRLPRSASVPRDGGAGH